MTDHRCMRCDSPLTGDEIALYKKLVFREAEQYLCLDCMASGLSEPREKLEKLIQYFHRTGICTLFAKYETER
jgi:hypothetical protein